MIEHEIIIRPALDKRHTDPSKNYGIQGCDMVFYAKGASGAIQFVLYTQWHLPHVQKELSAKCKGGSSYCPRQPLPADIGYHSKVPMYDGQEPIDDNCKLTGGRCYYDGSGLQAEQYYEILVRGGLDALWEALDQRYYDTFTEEPKSAVLAQEARQENNE